MFQWSRLAERGTDSHLLQRRLPGLKSREKYEQFNAQNEKQKQLEAQCLAALAEDDENMAHIAKLEAKYKRRQERAAAATIAAAAPTSKAAWATISTSQSSKQAASTSGRSSSRKGATHTNSQEVDHDTTTLTKLPSRRDKPRSRPAKQPKYLYYPKRRSPGIGQVPWL